MSKNNYLQIRLKDIAEKAGVSVGTVDRVIHKRGEVSQETRTKILKIIEDSNYSPNLMASSLASSRKFTIAVLIPEPIGPNSFWSEHQIGINRAAAELAPFGLVIEMFKFSIKDTRDFRSKSEELLRSNPNSLLLAPVFHKESVHFLKKCSSRNLPFAFIDTPITNYEPISSIGQNSCQSGMVAAKLLSLGHTHPSKYLVFNITQEKDQLHHLNDREKGFKLFFENKGEVINMSSYHIHDDGISTLCQTIDNHLKKEQTINGIFVTGSQVFRVAEALKELKKRDIRLLGYDLTNENKAHLRDNTIDFLINQQPEEQGYLGIISIFNKIVRKVEVPPIQALPIDIITRENLDHYPNCL